MLFHFTLLGQNFFFPAYINFWNRGKTQGISKRFPCGHPDISLCWTGLNNSVNDSKRNKAKHKGWISQLRFRPGFAQTLSRPLRNQV